MTPATDPTLPPPSVLKAFRLTGQPVPLEGGQGQSVRVGDAVLKPAGDSANVEWTAGLMDGLQDRKGFRVPRFLRSARGGYVAEGWEATRFLTGEPGPADRWDALLTAGRAFHAALRDVPRPDRLDVHQHPWAVADRVAWGDAAVDMPAHLHRLTTRLQALRVPVDARAQLIHGDLTGNVLFAPGRAPAIIDFSPYWRPALYADAIVVVDGLLHHRAGPRLVDSALPCAEGAQMLLRALIFRVAASGVLAGRGGAPAEDESIRFTRVSRFVEERLAG